MSRWDGREAGAQHRDSRAEPAGPGAPTGNRATKATVVVLKPRVRYAQIAAAFAADGWRGGPTTLTPPLVPGEPELAAWRRDGTVARYDCNPVVWLRVLRVAGLTAPPPLPALQRHDVQHLLASSTPDDQLLGVLAAAVLALAEARPAVVRLATRSQPAVRTAARHALRRLKG